MEFCDECCFEMDLCKKCHEEAACADCDGGICTACYLGMDYDEDRTSDYTDDECESLAGASR